MLYVLYFIVKVVEVKCATVSNVLGGIKRKHDIDESGSPPKKSKECKDTTASGRPNTGKKRK